MRVGPTRQETGPLLTERSWPHEHRHGAAATDPSLCGSDQRHQTVLLGGDPSWGGRGQPWFTREERVRHECDRLSRHPTDLP